MKKYIGIILVILIMIGIGALALYVYAYSGQSEQKSNEKPREVMSQEQTEPEPDSKSQQIAVSGRYIDYTDNVIKDTKGTKILFFHAPWCPQCRDIEESIQNTDLPADLTIIKVDYDSNQALRQKYGVTLQTTFVKIDDNGEKLKSFVAYNEPTFDSVRRELL